MCVCDIFIFISRFSRRVAGCGDGAAPLRSLWSLPQLGSHARAAPGWSSAAEGTRCPAGRTNSSPGKAPGMRGVRDGGVGGIPGGYGTWDVMNDGLFVI